MSDPTDRPFAACSRGCLGPRLRCAIATAIVAVTPLLHGCGNVQTGSAGDAAPSNQAQTDLPLIVRQPASVSVTAGDPATFAVAAVCPSGILQVQWQELDGDDFIDIVKAVHERISFDTSPDDSGSKFRAWLSCNGKTEVLTQVVSLTVPAPTALLMTP
ncbi:hypothetical protein BH10PSE17_BH10PSE17_18800 [soil metagenome]